MKLYQKSKRYSSTMMHKIMLTYLFLIVCMIGVTTGYSLYTDIDALNQEIDGTLSDFSYLFSKDQRIKTMIEAGVPDPGLTSYLDGILERLNKVDLIVIADEDAIRLYHPEQERVGLPFAGGDEQDILAGADSYVTDGVGTRQFQRRSFTAVKDDQDQVIGFVMVSAYKNSIKEMQIRIVKKALLFAVTSLLVALLLAWVLSKNIKKSLLGLEPAQLTKLYLQKEEVLDTLEEGVLAVDQTGSCILLNASAKRMLALEESQSDHAVYTFIQNNLLEVLDCGVPEHNCELDLNDNAILVDKIPIVEQGKQVGVVCLLKNKTELQNLAEQLTGVNHIVAALRANTHEYINKLHVILGLLQIGDTDTAIDYIEHVKREENEDFSLVMNRIENRTMAALIMGKKRRAKERDIELTLRKDSRLEAHNDYLSANDLVTIVGNLLENAMDAVDQTEGVREISLFIGNDEDGLTIQVDDTGAGMTTEQIEKIKEGRFSTKGEGRGVGLWLIRKIVERSDGILDIESEPAEGTSFTISINKKRRRSERWENKS